ncbi:MAG TPA: 2-oxoglutarate dehydrogenase, E2 component, dihydrolipoamide succinyltransferase [Nocardioidaceae bacterium]|nr:2-oxoglutarate dehydrogenase, E2 component, dihydrolipoamide succinyltransferase [Nocardioidaceae bacterium]
MATEVTLPALGESVTEGTVTTWLKNVGDEVSMDEPLLEISTDKVDTEIPSPAAGKLLEIRAQQDETVAVGAVLAVIGDSADADGGGGSPQPDGQPQHVQQQEQDQQAATQAPPQPAAEQQAAAPPQPAAEQEAQPAPAEPEPAAMQQTDGGQPSVPQEGQPAPVEAQPAQDSAPAPSGGGSAGASSGGTEVTLPALGESVTEGTVTAWLKNVGDDVAMDEPLLEISTDKVDTEIPSPAAGKLLEIRVQQDETVAVGAVLAVIGSAADQRQAPAQPPQEAPPAQASGQAAQGAPEAPAQGATEAPAAAPAPTPPAPPEQPTPPPAPAPPTQPQAQQPQAQQPQPSGAQQAPGQPTPAEPPTDPRAPSQPSEQEAEPSYVTPLVRKLAAQYDVDLTSLTGTGVGGRIRKQDVLEAAERARQPEPQPETPAAPAAAAAPAASPLRGTTQPLSRIRKVIAARMVESLQVSAQLTTVVEVDVTGIARLRDRVRTSFEQREGVKLSFLPFFAKAAVDALKSYPQLNASIDTEAGTVTYHDAEHLSIAVDTEKGLMVPVVKDAGDLSIAGLARKVADVAQRTRENRISPDELSGGTFTITNTGSRGALFDTPILNQPQVGMLGTGAVVKRPVVISDEELGETIAVRQMAYLSLTYDHRMVDGADAARFLVAVKQRLEDAKFESDLGI